MLNYPDGDLRLFALFYKWDKVEHAEGQITWVSWQEICQLSAVAQALAVM